MKEMMKKLMEKESQDGDKSTSAKMNALKELHKMASDAMSDDLSEMQKVTVAAKNKKGLKEGLDKAKEILGGKMEKE